MNCKFNLLTALSMGIATLLMVSPSNAQTTLPQTGTTQAVPAQNQIQTDQDTDDELEDSNAAGNLDSRTVGTTIRASQLMGMNLENAAGENVGEIKDVVLDSQSGKIKYIAVTYGGFLGIGNDIHAVPYKAIKFKQDPDDADDTVLELNVTKEQMAGATGFNEDTWPNFADRKFTRSIDQRYNIERTHTKGSHMKDDHHAQGHHDKDAHHDKDHK